jgi:hypothetical protein
MEYGVLKSVSKPEVKLTLLRSLCVSNEGLYEAIQLANEHNKDPDTKEILFFDNIHGNWEYHFKLKGSNERI